MPTSCCTEIPRYCYRTARVILATLVQGSSARRGRLLGENLSKVTAEQMTAVRATIRVIGPDVDPFNSAKQASL